MMVLYRLVQVIATGGNAQLAYSYLVAGVRFGWPYTTPKPASGVRWIGGAVVTTWAPTPRDCMACDPWDCTEALGSLPSDASNLRFRDAAL